MKNVGKCLQSIKKLWEDSGKKEKTIEYLMDHSLPDVDDSDNGNILKVVSGMWDSAPPYAIDQEARDAIEEITVIESIETLDTDTNLATTLERGYYTTAGGSMVFNNNANFSHMKIAVTPGTKYQINKTHNIYTFTAFNALGVFVDSDGNYVNSIVNVLGALPVTAPYDIVAPAGAAQMYLSTDYVYTASPVETTVYKYLESAPQLMLNSEKLNRTPAFISDLSENNRKLKLVAGVVRNSGNGWEFIDDANHKPLNLNSVSVDNNGYLKIEYTFEAKNVISLIVVPDEAFAKLYTIGGSVGKDNSVFYIYTTPKTYGGLITINTNETVNVNNSSFTSGTFNSLTGEIRLYHEDLTDLPAAEKFNITACGRQYEVRSGSQGNDYVSLFMYDNDGTVVKTLGSAVNVLATRTINQILMDANDVISAYGNFWILGIMEIE